MNKFEPDFVEDLFEQQGTPLLKYLSARFGNKEEAQEIAQEAWVRMLRLEHPGKLNNAKAFLFQTASNLAVDRLRRSRLEQRYLEQETAEGEYGADVQETVTDRESLNIINAALDELPPKCQQAFTLHRVNGLSYPEIAEQLGVSTSMVEKYIIQALKHFRNKLNRP